MNPFTTIAEGYARDRPPVHVEILRRALSGVVECAVDVGCGSGLSTLALKEFARRRIGVEPVEAMVEAARSLDPAAEFLVGPAEALPVSGGSVDLLTAAGSLNYADLPRFFVEARRVLRPSGLLLVYDFSSGSVAGSDWLTRFVERYPWAPREARFLDPSILAAEATGFSVLRSESFAVSLTLSRAFYLDYMMTETNVAYAVRRGESLASIREWCEETLWPEASAEVVFPGYFVVFAALS